MWVFMKHIRPHSAIRILVYFRQASNRFFFIYYCFHRRRFCSSTKSISPCSITISGRNKPTTNCPSPSGKRSTRHPTCPPTITPNSSTNNRNSSIPFRSKRNNLPATCAPSASKASFTRSAGNRYHLTSPLATQTRYPKATEEIIIITPTTVRKTKAASNGAAFQFAFHPYRW